MSPLISTSLDPCARRPARLGARFFTWICGLGLTSAGCYQGAPPPPSPAAETTDSTSTGPESEAEADSGGSSTGTPEVDDAAPFELPTDQVQLLPFPARMANLAAVAHVRTDHPMFEKAYELRILLGQHDYSQIAGPDSAWTADRVQNWVRAISPVCASLEVHTAYPDLVQDPRALMRTAFGREPTDAEVEALGQLTAAAADEQEAFRWSCLAVLSSLEFVAF